MHASMFFWFRLESDQGEWLARNEDIVKFSGKIP